MIDGVAIKQFAEAVWYFLLFISMCCITAVVVRWTHYLFTEGLERHHEKQKKIMLDGRWYEATPEVFVKYFPTRDEDFNFLCLTINRDGTDLKYEIFRLKDIIQFVTNQSEYKWRVLAIMNLPLPPEWALSQMRIRKNAKIDWRKTN